MNFDPKVVRRALMVAKDIATKIDPGFAVHKLPMPPEGVPLERAKGGEVKNVLPVGSPERSQNLREWLGDSFLHDEGNPRTYYHGTSKDKPFTGFKVGRHGAWFTSDPKDASMYAEANDSMSSRFEGGRFVPQNTASRVMPVYLKASNPFLGEFPEKYKNVENYKKAQSEWFDELRANGYDSWIPRSQEGNLAVMLEGPHQVKSAIGNVGTFDPSSPDIAKAEGGAIDEHPDQGYSPKPPGILDVDNPGGDWLKENREYSESKGYLPSGAPNSFGKVTAVWRKPKSNEIAPVYLPVSMLAKLPGVMSEQGNVRSHDLDWLVDHMGKTGKLPKVNDREYKPFITVDHRGKPFVSEGNHRIMAAAKLGWDYLPVEVRYFNGAEDVDGPLHPDRLKAMHAPHKAEGGAVDDEMQARNLNPMGMYSAAAEAARNLPQERGTLQQMLATMKGVKPDELRWSGVQDKFAGQKTVTRDELAQHFEQRMPPLRENVRVESATEGPDARYGQYTLPGGQNYREVVMHMRPEDVEQTYPNEKMSYKSSHWQEPNVVAHLRLKDRDFAPAKKPPKPDTQANIMMNTPLDPSGQAMRPVDAWSTPTPGLVVTKSMEPDEKGQYRVTHLGTGLNATGGNAYPFHQAMDAAKRLGEIWDGWTQDPDTVKAWAKDNGKLAREALKKASNPFAKKVLHIEELQSDWAQQGRDIGFRNAAAFEKANAEMGKWRNEMSKAYIKSLDDRLSEGKPLQPFEKVEMLKGHYQDLSDLRNYFLGKGFKIVEHPLENDEYGLFVTDKNDNLIDDEEFANKFDNSSAIYDLDRMRGAYNAIQNFEKKSKEDPAFRKLKVGTYVAGLSPQKLAERLGQDAIEKTEALSKAIAKGGGGHDEGPYVTNTNQWTDLGLKRALVEAARGGYDKLIWTPGEAQADRYKLNNFVDALRYKRFDDGHYHISAERNGRTVHADKYKPEDLPGVVGQELAKKIISGEGEPTREDQDSAKVIKGIDLNVGGRGMYEYYDKILPRRLMALAQEHDPEAQIKPLKSATGKMKNLPSLDITPRMRDSILKRGFKAFKRGGAVQAHLFPHHDEPKSVEVPVMDHEKAIRRALMIAKAEGGPIGGTQSTKGLPFPEEETAFRLRTKLNREAKVAAGKADPGLPSNPRMVIRAPKAKESETQLPNFIVGPLTHKDWIARHEKILSPEEIQHSSQWYKNIYGNFLQYTNNNEPEAKKLMRAWLVAQQNVSPAGAMQNVLLQREQMQRGVPEPLWRAGGMPNPTNAARSVLRDQPISGGVGQKISDFVDSAEGLDTRSYLGHDPQGGSPFVIDVHSARDAGLVDPALINHLKNLGYNENDLAKVQTDFEASPSDAQYENRAQWGRDLTKYLNKIGWQGKKDWRPEEIQAVGWMGMTKLTRNAEEDSASGLGRNLRRVSFELSPGEGSPWAQKYGTAFESLPDEERYGITQKMSNRAMQIASELSGVNPLSTVHGTGAWMQYQNPAAVGQALATQGGADIMANTIGHLLHQTEVWHNRVKPVTSSPKGFAIDFIESGSQNLADRGQLRDFWQKITDADKTGLIQGYQPITLPNGQVGVRALIDKGGLGTHKKLTETLQEGGDLDKMLKELPFDVESQIAEAEITKARNDWKENQNGQAYLQRLSDLMGSDPSARLSAYGSQLEKELQGHLDEAYARQGRSWRATTPQGQQTQVKAPETPPLPTMAYGGAIDKALQIAQRART